MLQRDHLDGNCRLPEPPLKKRELRMNEEICAAICDAIDQGYLNGVDSLDSDEGITQAEALAYLALARISDPSESGHAAHIRDLIRDSYGIDP